MNNQDYSQELSTEETDRSRSVDIENKTLCPFSGKGFDIPKGHEKYSESDKEKCPVMSGMIKAPALNGDTAENLPEGTTKKKEKKPKGGCPFMSSDNKKAPALESYPAGYEEVYNSTMKYLLNYKETPNKSASIPEAKRWGNIPMFLKHTLFHDEEKMDKIRKMEISQRFLIYDQFREQANKSFNKGRTEEAIGLYEHALSCFKWLKYKDIKQEKEKKVELAAIKSEISENKDSQLDKEEEKEISYNKENTAVNSKDENNIKKEAAEEEEDTDPYKDFKPINKALLKPLTDENIEIFDGEEIDDDGEKDMRNSMLIGVYHGLAVCYLRLHHYSLALAAVEEGLKVNDCYSQLYYRRSQVRALNKGSTLEELLQAKQDIERAIELIKDEKIFKSEPGMLKVLNIHNAEEAFQNQALYIDALIKEKRQAIDENLRAIMSKVREIQYLEDAFRKEGKKVPFDTSNSGHAVDINHNDDDQMEWEVTQEIIKKYNKLIEFYQGTERKDQVQLARKEIQTALEVYAKMKFYRDLDFNQWEQDENIRDMLKEIKIDMSNERVQERLRRFKHERSKEVFENGEFNLEVYQYALKDYLKRKGENEQKAKKGKSGHHELEPKKKRVVSLFGFEFNVQIVALAIMVLAFWFLSKKGLLPAGLLWADSQGKGSL